MPRFEIAMLELDGQVQRESVVSEPDDAAAHERAIREVRQLVAAMALEGVIDLSGRVEVRDQEGNLVSSTALREAFDVLPGVSEDDG